MTIDAILVDTNRYSDYAALQPDAIDLIDQADLVFLPFVVVAELRAGFALGHRAAENERLLRQVLSTPRVSVLWPDDETTHRYSTLYASLRRHGLPIPTHDVWIAALAVQHDLPLYTRDDHFRHLPQVRLV